MNKSLTAIFCSIYDTFIFKRHILHSRDAISVTEEHKGSMTYVIFSNAYGGLVQSNYTLDSAEFENQKKFYK